MAGQGGQNKVTGMEKITTKPGQAPVAHFVSGLDECETKTVVWEIQNFADLMELPREEITPTDTRITFDAGHSIGIPATFCLNLIRYRYDGNDSMDIINLLTLSPDSKAKLVKASCSISLSCEGETFASADRGPQEFMTPLPWNGDGYAYLQTWPSVTDTDVLQKTDNGRKALKITLTLKVFSSKEPVEIPKANPLKADDVISDFGKLLESEDGADLEISVPSVFGGELDASAHTRKVHKSILIARSPVFSRMFAENSEMVEAKTGKVVIEDLSPQGLGVLLHYIYTGKVLGEWVKIPAEILNAAEKYDLGRLKNYCGHNLMSAVTTKNAIALYKMAKLHKLSFAKSAIAEFVSKNSKAVLEDCDEDGSDDGDAE